MCGFLVAKGGFGSFLNSLNAVGTILNDLLGADNFLIDLYVVFD
jgi:hypothetical protein